MVVILESLHGSRAYGLATETSDKDRKGIFVPDAQALHGFLPTPEQVEPRPECVHYDIRKFFRLAAVCNPTVIEVLFTEADDVLVRAPAGDRLLAGREAFLSRRAGDSFGRYGLSQLKRIKTHRRWLLTPPKERPERQTYGLPARTVVSRDQMGAAEALIRDGRLEEAGAATVKGVLYVYRAALTGIHLMKTGECVGDALTLAALYGYSRVIELIEAKRTGTETATLSDDRGYREDWGRLEAELAQAQDQSPLPEQSPNMAAGSALLIDQRRRALGC